jgi:hypothetical protein
MNKTDADIHNVESTHHHDQSIFPISFSVINTIVSNPTKPIPPLELVELVLMFPPLICSHSAVSL